MIQNYDQYKQEIIVLNQLIVFGLSIRANIDSNRLLFVEVIIIVDAEPTIKITTFPITIKIDQIEITELSDTSFRFFQAFSITVPN